MVKVDIHLVIHCVDMVASDPLIQILQLVHNCSLSGRGVNP